MQTAPPEAREAGADPRTFAFERVMIALSGAAAFAYTVWPRERWILDDALIFQNFVRSALEGGGLVYGPGEPAEGYSSPLWALILVGCGLAGARGFLVAKIVGALCGAAAVALVALLPRRVPFVVLLVGAVVIGLHPALAWWGASGMETPLATLLVTALAVGVFLERPWAVAAAAGLLVITRPEGALFAVAAAVWFVCFARGGGAAPTARRVAPWVAAMLAPAVAWEVYRLAVYGALVANSAAAKLGTTPVAGPLEQGRGVHYVFASFLHFPAAWVLGLLGAAALLERRGDPRARAEVAFFAAVFGLVFAFVWAADGDWMPFSRFVVPLVPAMVLLAIVHLGETRQRSYWLAIGASLGLLAMQHHRDFAPAFSYQGGQYLLARWPGSGASSFLPFRTPHLADAGAHFYAKHVLKYTAPGDSILHVDVGQSGFVMADVRTIDTFGLVSRFECEWQRGRRSDAELVEHVRELRPSVVFLLVESTSGQPVMTLTRPLVPLFADYVEVERRGWWGRHIMKVLVRPDAVRRVADPARFASWQARSPGLLFRGDLLMQQAAPAAPEAEEADDEE